MHNRRNLDTAASDRKRVVNFQRWSDMAKIIHTKSVPQNMQTAYDSIVALTDAFCRDHLDDDYRELAERMAATLCRMRTSPVISGSPGPGPAPSSMYWVRLTFCRTGRHSRT